MKRTALVVAFAAALAVSGCSPETDTDDGGTVQKDAVADAPAGSAADPADGAPEDPPAAADEPAGDAPAGADTGGARTVAYGKTYTSPSGISITASVPEPFTPSESAVADERFTKHIKLTVRVKNGTKKAWDANQLLASAVSGDKPSDQVFDYERGVGAEWRTVLPGRTLTVTMAFGYQPAKPFTLSLETFGGPLVTYDGVVK